MIVTDVDGPPIQRTLAITVRAAIVNNPPMFTFEEYSFNLSENANDNDEIGLIAVTDDSGLLIAMTENSRASV